MERKLNYETIKIYFKELVIANEYDVSVLGVARILHVKVLECVCIHTL